MIFTCLQVKTFAKNAFVATSFVQDCSPVADPDLHLTVGGGGGGGGGGAFEGLTMNVKIFQFLPLTVKFMAVLRLTVNPLETLYSAKIIPADQGKCAISNSKLDPPLQSANHVRLREMSALQWRPR